MSRRRLVLAVVLYALLTGAGVGLSAFFGRPNALWHPSPWLELSPARAFAASAGLGVLVGIVTVWMTQALVARAQWAVRLHEEFRRLLGPMSRVTVAILALGSSLGEEVFFRGAMQPWAGWVLTSFAFGLLHIGPTRTLLPWTAWAVVMGLLFGAIFEATGSLAGPLIAHAWINYCNLRFISTFDPRDPRAPGRAPPAPRLVGRPERR